MARERIEEFLGIARDVHRAKLPPGQFQVDEGSDHYERGTWKVRRGQRHTDILRKAGKIETLLGFELAGGDFALVVGSLGNVCGHLNVAQQADGMGMGEGGFGEGGFGG